MQDTLLTEYHDYIAGIAYFCYSALQCIFQPQRDALRQQRTPAHMVAALSHKQ